MADFKQDGPRADGSQMRERPSVKPLHLRNPEDAKQKVLELNQGEEDNNNEEKRKTYGRTPDGTGGWAFDT
jgi:phosphatidylethanolamine N-methyltransferase